jgi:hypothetical protein
MKQNSVTNPSWPKEPDQIKKWNRLGDQQIRRDHPRNFAMGAYAMATDGLTTIPSSFGPKQTTDRLEAEIKASMTVFARIDHAAGAAEFGLPLWPPSY